MSWSYFVHHFFIFIYSENVCCLSVDLALGSSQAKQYNKIIKPQHKSNPRHKNNTSPSTTIQNDSPKSVEFCGEKPGLKYHLVVNLHMSTSLFLSLPYLTYG